VRAQTQALRLRCQAVRGFATTEWRARQTSQRHGKAVEPYPISSGGDGSTNNTKVVNPGEGSKEQVKGKERKKTDADEKATDAAEEKPRDTAPEPPPEDPLPDKKQGTVNASQLDNGTIPEPAPAQQPAANTPGHLTTLETVLEMPPPDTQDQEDAAKPPHLQTPPYVHHFDTYTLVQQVEAGDFSTEQSITSMKAVRALLAHNLDIAKAGLVSKSDVENVSLGFVVTRLVLIMSSGKLSLSRSML
jgi:hypothetical protein